MVKRFAKFGQLVLALAFGLLAALIGVVLSELVSAPSMGHRIDTAAWPADARAITAENPGVPMNADQWRRLNKVLATTQGAQQEATILLWANVRHSWYWFCIVPTMALGALWRRQRQLSSLVPIAVFFPSAITLLLAFLFASRSGLLQ